MDTHDYKKQSLVLTPLHERPGIFRLEVEPQSARTDGPFVWLYTGEDKTGGGPLTFQSASELRELARLALKAAEYIDAVDDALRSEDTQEAATARAEAAKKLAEMCKDLEQEPLRWLRPIEIGHKIGSNKARVGRAITALNLRGNIPGMSLAVTSRLSGVGMVDVHTYSPEAVEKIKAYLVAQDAARRAAEWAKDGRDHPDDTKYF